MILGAILGDIIGSPYEFDVGDKTKDFELFNKNCIYTDDTVMTCAIMKAIINADKRAYYNDMIIKTTNSMRELGNKHMDAGYGGLFHRWLNSPEPTAYNSYGNGSAMRVSPVGWAYDTLYDTRLMAQATAVVTHDHPEGIKGAECVASVIYLARNGKPKHYIEDYIINEFNYDLSKSLHTLRKEHEHCETCQDSLPKALTSFFDGNDYEDVVRNAVSLGGDTDTIAAIAGSMAEAMYGIPKNIIDRGIAYIPQDLLDIVCEFDNILK